MPICRLSGLLFVPFGVFPRETAYLLYTMVGRLTVLAMTYWLVKLSHVRDWKLWLLLFLIAFNGPLDRILWLGNSTHFILLLLLAAMYALQARRPILAGVFFGLAPLLKTVHAVARRVPRLAAELASRVCLGRYVGHVRSLVPESCSGTICTQSGSRPASCSFKAARFPRSGRSQLTDSSPSTGSPAPASTTGRPFRSMRPSASFTTSVSSSSWSRPPWRPCRPGRARSPERPLLEVSIFICAAILISPISWSHYYLFLLLPVACYAGGRFPQRRRTPRLTWTLGFAFVAAVVLFSLPEEVSVTYYRAEESDLARLLLSHYFFGGVLFYVFLIAERFVGEQPT